LKPVKESDVNGEPIHSISRLLVLWSQLTCAQPTNEEPRFADAELTDRACGHRNTSNFQLTASSGNRGSPQVWHPGEHRLDATVGVSDNLEVW